MTPDRRPPVALATSAAERTRDVELGLVVDELARRGVEARPAVWDDAAEDWDAYALVVVRSCWDYASRREEFLAWAARVPRLANPAPVLAWNTDKRYLRDLAERGVPVIETAWDPASAEELPDAAEWVCKPSVSAGSRDTARWGTPDDVLAHARSLREAGRTAMVQPYVDSVDVDGETAVLHLGGTFSHAVRKGPLLARDEGVRQDRDSRGDVTERTPSAEQHAVAAHALAAAADATGHADPLLYARVDLVADADGAPRVIELELTEPGLFLPWAPGSAARLAGAVATRLPD